MGSVFVSADPLGGKGQGKPRHIKTRACKKIVENLSLCLEYLIYDFAYSIFT